ncbi:hypothetical protein RND71_020800 [Anisodus tanguticus]|uniref:Cupin type-1 domain-containing protein n=1 Tax=Anisodus tanguticus TaxID=243964 RepID=A0AAE1VC98_9SOLA|nr:hypothetical protein RND71_020800 [Anisodus tanguticus]
MLQTGDVFVFPKGLVHFQYNADAKIVHEIYSAFGSANAGTSSVPNSVVNTSTPDKILAKSFKTDIITILKLKAVDEVVTIDKRGGVAASGRASAHGGSLGGQALHGRGGGSRKSPNTGTAGRNIPVYAVQQEL